MISITLKLSFSKLTRSLCILTILLTALSLNIGAQTTTFAQFLEQDASNDFVFTNNTTSADFQTVSGGSPIFLRYSNISGLDSSLTGFQSAHMIITTTTTSPASLITGTLTQPLTSVVTVQIIRDSPAPVGVGNGSRTNLLTATFSRSVSDPSIVGSSGGSAATLQATTPDNTVTYTSDFLNFASTTSRNLSASFSSVSPSLSLGAGGFLQSFVAAGSGTFASNPPPTYLGPTAAPVSVNGRILSPSGSGLQNAVVTLTESNGTVQTTLASSYGYFNFPAVESGQTVVISVQSKRFQFDPQIATLNDDITDLQLIGH
jgi:hypothetical protein